MKRLLLSGFLAVGAVWLFWSVSREGGSHADQSDPDAGSGPSVIPRSAESGGQSVQNQAGSGEQKQVPLRTGVRVEDQLLAGPRLELQQGELEWEARVRWIRENPNLDERAKAGQFLKLLGGGLPEEALESVAEEAVRCLRSQDYVQATGLLLDAQTHGRVQSVLFADLVERPDPVRLPWLLAVARVPGHPFSKVAAEDLELFLGANHGGNWARWEESIRLFLAKSSARSGAGM